MSLVRFRRNRTGLRGYVHIYIRRRKRKKMLLLYKITFSFLERLFIGCSSQSFYFTENSKSLTSSSKCFKNVLGLAYSLFKPNKSVTCIVCTLNTFRNRTGLWGYINIRKDRENIITR